MPIRPTIAAWRVFTGRAHLVDRSLGVSTDQGPVSTHLGFVATIYGPQFFARTQHAAFHNLAERYTGFRPLGLRNFQGLTVKFANFRKAFFGNGAVLCFTLNTDVIATKHFGDGASGASSKERV